jgi:Raf kinase inhibitor-like YbhB/YbcL family protein
MIITSPLFDDGAAIPKKFTGDGGDFNPELLIQNVPPEAKSLALILHDPDAKRDGGFTHWVVWNIDPTTTIIKEESVPPESVEGMNGADKIGYMGPYPPEGDTHHYHFHLYALDEMLDIDAGTEAEVARAEIEKHTIAEAELVGTYSRSEE